MGYVLTGTLVRSLQFIEDYIVREVLPSYGNTHTTTSFTSRQSTHFREEARLVTVSLPHLINVLSLSRLRLIIRNAVNASEKDCVIFTGNGCTGAIHNLIHNLNLSKKASPVKIFYVGLTGSMLPFIDSVCGSI